MLKANDYRQYTMFHLRKLKADGMDKNCRRWRLILCAQKSIYIFLLKFPLRNGRTWVHFAAQNGKTIFWRIHVKCAPCHFAVQWLGPWFCSSVLPFRSKIKWFPSPPIQFQWGTLTYHIQSIYTTSMHVLQISELKPEKRSLPLYSPSPSPHFVVWNASRPYGDCMTCTGAGWYRII